MTQAVAPGPGAARTTPVRLRVTMARALWCWLIAALALGFSRAVVALGSGLAPVPFAAYSVLIFVLIPAVPGLVAIAVVAGAQRATPPAWVHALVVGLAVGGWAFFATLSPGWGFGYAVAGAAAAAVAFLARSRRSVRARVGVAIVGIALLGAAWFSLETLA